MKTNKKRKGDDSMKITLEYPDRDETSWYVEAWTKVCKNGKCYDEPIPGYYYVLKNEYCPKDEYFAIGSNGSSDKLVATNTADFLKYLEAEFKKPRRVRRLLCYLNLRRLRLLSLIRRVFGKDGISIKIHATKYGAWDDDK